MSDKTNFAGKTVLITGASGGIGSAVARSFSAEGASVALQYYNNRPEALENEITQNGGKSICVKADLSQDGFETGLLDKIGVSLGPVNILVNCAASQDIAAFEKMNASEFNAMMQMNVGAVFALSKLFAARLPTASTDNSIVNISSLEAQHPAMGHGHYACSKAALETLTKAMALEFGPSGLRVNAVAPGLISRTNIERDWPEGVERWNDKCPLQRLGTPQNIADAVLFLASPQASWITGSILSVDGGMSAGPGW